MTFRLIASERTGNLLERGLEGLRCARLGGYFTTWCDDDARAAVDRVAHALGADSELQFADAALARSAAFIISASEGGNQYLADLRHSPERFEPHSRERLLAGAMIPLRMVSAGSAFSPSCPSGNEIPVPAQADVLIAPATPCSATPIGAEEMVINGQPLPVRASMGMLTQPISFLGSAGGDRALRTASGKPIGLQLIAAPFNGTSLSSRRAGAGSDGHYRCPSGGECSMINLDNVDRPAILAEVTAAFYQYEEALVSAITSRRWMRYSGTTRAHRTAGEPAKICMASRRSAPFAPPAPPPVWPAICAIPPLPPLVRIWRCAAPSSPARAAPAWAASSRPGYASLRLADCRRPVSLMDWSGVYGSGPETKVSTGPLPVR